MPRVPHNSKIKREAVLAELTSMAEGRHPDCNTITGGSYETRSYSKPPRSFAMRFRSNTTTSQQATLQPGCCQPDGAGKWRSSTPTRWHGSRAPSGGRRPPRDLTGPNLARTLFDRGHRERVYTPESESQRAAPDPRFKRQRASARAGHPPSNSPTYNSRGDGVVFTDEPSIPGGNGWSAHLGKSTPASRPAESRKKASSWGFG